MIFRLHSLNWLMLFIDLFISGYIFRPSNGRIQTVNNCSNRKLVFYFYIFLQIDALYIKTLFLSWAEKSSKENLSRLIQVLLTCFRQCVKYVGELNTSAGTVTSQRAGREKRHYPISDRCTNEFFLLASTPNLGSLHPPNRWLLAVLSLE